MLARGHSLPLVRQCELLGVARSTFYHQPQPVGAADLALMRRLDEIHLRLPFLGSRRMVDELVRWTLFFGQWDNEDRRGLMGAADRPLRR